MTSWQLTRLIGGTFILLSLALGRQFGTIAELRARQPHLPFDELAVVHRLRRRQLPAKWLHQVVPDGNHHAQDRRPCILIQGETHG